MILIRYGKKEDSVELYALIGKEWEGCFILLLERYFGVRAIVEKKVMKESELQRTGTEITGLKRVQKRAWSRMKLMLRGVLLKVENMKLK